MINIKNVQRLLLLNAGFFIATLRCMNHDENIAKAIRKLPFAKGSTWVGAVHYVNGTIELFKMYPDSSIDLKRDKKKQNLSAKDINNIFSGYEFEVGYAILKKQKDREG